MAITQFYYGTVKNIIVTFGTLFDNIQFMSEHAEVIKVPISFAPKSKFIEYYTSEPSFDSFDTRFTLPRMAFELVSMTFAPERFNNPLSKMKTSSSSNFMFARVPYDFTFQLYLATKSFEDSLKIIEQIIPYFNPEFTVTINDKNDFNLKTDVPVVLRDSEFRIDYEGSFDTKRTIEWTLTFVVKAYLYLDVKAGAAIKETIVNMTDFDINKKFEQLVSEVVPRTANKTDPHTIVSDINGPDETWVTP